MAVNQPSRRETIDEPQHSSRPPGAPPPPTVPAPPSASPLPPGVGLPAPSPPVPPGPSPYSAQPAGAYSIPPVVLPEAPRGNGVPTGVWLAAALIAFLVVGGAIGYTISALGSKQNSSTVVALDASTTQVAPPVAPAADPNQGSSPQVVPATPDTVSHGRPAPTAQPTPTAAQVTSPPATSPPAPEVADEPPPPGRYLLGPLSFSVSSEYTPTKQGEPRDDGALRSEFAGSGGRQIVVEVNPGKVDGPPLQGAQELASSFRDQGRLIDEPFETQVGDVSTAVLNVNGTDGEFRADHFFNFDGNGMAVVGIDQVSIDNADAIARDVIVTVDSGSGS